MWVYRGARRKSKTVCMESTSSIPKQLGDFEILGELGRGGMGVVYEARQKSLNRRVALKVLSSSLGLTAKAVKRFRREAEAAAKLHHTNVVPIYATGEENGVHFYAMELIEGPSLDHVIRHMRDGDDSNAAADDGDSTTDQASQDMPDWVGETIAYEAPRTKSTSSSAVDSANKLSGSGVAPGTKYFDTVATMVAEVADALQHAHDQDVIHRDIKPSNLLLAPDGRLSVTDFGLARVLEQPGMTMSGEFVGTPRYMSPEQISAGRAPLDHRTDIYSLGAALYELLTLQPPFSGKTRDEVIGQILHKEPKPPRRLNKRISTDLETICLKALERDPDRRYQTAGQMAEDLRAYVNRFAISAKRVGIVGRTKKWVLRHPSIAVLMALLLVMSSVAGLFALQAVNARQELIARLRDDALIAILSGDRDNAVDRIREASSAGLDEGWSILLTGLLKLHHEEPAREDLKLASYKLPNSTAAYAALVRAYYDEGMEVEYFRRIERLKEKEATRVEDKLLKGWALIHASAKDATDVLDSAFRENERSPIIRLHRADAYIRRAMEVRDADTMRSRAKEAIADAKYAMFLLPDHPSPKEKLLRACLLAAHACEELGDATQQKEWNQEAARLFNELDRHSSHPGARRARVEYANVTEDPKAEEIVFHDMETAYENNGRSHPFSAQYCSQMRFRRREYHEAVIAIKMAESSDRELSRFVHDLVEMTQADSVTANVELRRRFLNSLDDRLERTGKVFLGWDWIILRLLGAPRDHPAAKRITDEFAIGYESIPYWKSYSVFPHYMRTGDSTKLLRVAGGRRTSLLYAHLFLGVDALADGRRTDAIGHFEKAVGMGAHEMDGYGWAKAFLVHLNASEGEKVWLPWLTKRDEDK